MLRPIDTQTIYQQTPEVSNRQQGLKQGEELQQAQFAQIMHKETKEKQNVVIETRKDEKTDNNLDKKQGRRSLNEQKKYKKRKNDSNNGKNEDVKSGNSSHIDFRI